MLKERSAAWRGWDPFSSSYMDEALEYEDIPDWEVAKHCILKEEKSGAVDIIASMKNLIEFGQKMGFGDTAFEQLLLMFAKHELKEALAGITRFLSLGNLSYFFFTLPLSSNLSLEVPLYSSGLIVGATWL